MYLLPPKVLICQTLLPTTGSFTYLGNTEALVAYDVNGSVKFPEYTIAVPPTGGLVSKRGRVNLISSSYLTMNWKSLLYFVKTPLIVPLCVGTCLTVKGAKLLKRMICSAPPADEV